MKIQDLPKEIQILAELRAKEQNLHLTDEIDLSTAFTYEFSKEGIGFWKKINIGDFSPYYELYRGKTAPSETQTEWQPKKGEMVEVSNNIEEWEKREFYCIVDKCDDKYACYTQGYTDIAIWKYCRKIQHEFTIDEARAIISKSKGIELEKIIIK